MQTLLAISDSLQKLMIISDSVQKLITTTMVRWAEEDFISMQDLVREMFSLLHRQYDGIGELMTALEKTYVIGVHSREDINHLLKALGIIRSLLQVQAGRDEEELMKNSLKYGFSFILPL